MNILEKYFDTAFAAPNGIKKLRELILTLAMQGKLVPQDPGDAPARELLREIEAEKAGLVKAGKIKAQQPLPPIKPEEIPYQLPNGWEWIRLGSFLEMINGRAFKPTDWIPSGLPIVRIQNLNNPAASFNYCNPSDVKSQHLIDDSEFLISWSGTPGTSFGAFIWNGGKAALNQHIFKCFQIGSPYNDLFLMRAINSRLDFLISQAQGAVGLKHITKGTLEMLLLPLPPLAEQRRIVEKIDQLMARCDALEKLRAERDEKRLAVHAAALKRLIDSKGDESFADAWAFIKRHFSDLYSVKENVADLRKAILELAMKGKLVPQEPNDPPAHDLLREIEAEKARLVKAGKIKAQKPLPPIKPEEVPYQLPKGWEWVRLGILIELISGQHLTPDEYNQDKVGFSYYTGPADFGDKSPRATRWTTADRAIAIRDDILLTVKGAGVGKTNVVEEEKAAISRQLMALRVVKVDKFFVLYFLASIFSELQSLAVGIAIPGIGREDVLQRKFPLPPLAEQRRIVAKIDQLMALCDALEQHIEAATRKQTELLGAVMAV